MIFMLIDKKTPNSFFKPYYDILPETLSNMPIFWDAEELGYLKGSYLLDQIDERNAAIAANYEAICEVVPHFRSYATLQEFKWARMCVCSRNFGLVINGVQTAALVPYADMLNHYRPRETKWQFDDDLQSFTVVSLQHIRAGAQVYDSYGRKCNHRFLLNYGFSIESNVETDGYCPNEVSLHFGWYPVD
jgi:histone-lysine N-methyltransferase SETD3